MWHTVIQKHILKVMIHLTIAEIILMFTFLDYFRGTYQVPHTSKHSPNVKSLDPHNSARRWVFLLSSILQMRKVREREVNECAQGDTASK